MAKRPNRRQRPNLAVQTFEDSNPNVRKAVDFVERKHDMLDKSRAFGVVTGNEMIDGKRIAYEVGQGPGRLSKLYDNDLMRLYRPGEEEAEKAAAKKRQQRRPDDLAVGGRSTGASSAAEAAAELAAQSNDDDDDDDNEESLPPMASVDTSVQFVDSEDDGDEVNLAAWALGKKYRFALVRQAISERYHREVANEPDALDFLIGEGLVRGEEVKAAREAASKG